MSNAGKKAKVASKNNPTSRGSKVEYLHKGEVIVPISILFFSTLENGVKKMKKFIGAFQKNKKALILNEKTKEPLRWNSVPKKTK